MPKNTG